MAHVNRDCDKANYNLQSTAEPGEHRRAANFPTPTMSKVFNGKVTFNKLSIILPQFSTVCPIILLQL